MKNILLKIFSPLLLILLVGCSSNTLPIMYTGERMPNTRITLLDGTYVSLENYLGKPLVILFWARWCSHCRSFIPKLNQYASEVQQEKVTFLAVSVDDNKDFDKVQEFIDSNHLTSLQHAFSGNGVYDEAFLSYGIDEFPKVVVHDSEGKITKVTLDISEIRSEVRNATNR